MGFHMELNCHIIKCLFYFWDSAPMPFLVGVHASLMPVCAKIVLNHYCLITVLWL